MVTVLKWLAMFELGCGLDPREGDGRNDALHHRSRCWCVCGVRGGQGSVGRVAQQAVAMAADATITSTWAGHTNETQCN